MTGAPARVAFSDVDMHGNMHNARFLTVAEDAVDTALRDAGVDLAFDPAADATAFYVRRAAVTFARPLRHRDRYRAAVTTMDVTAAALSFAVELRGLDPAPWLAATVSIDWVHVDVASGRPARLPEELAAALETAAPETAGQETAGQETGTARDGG